MSTPRFAQYQIALHALAHSGDAEAKAFMQPEAIMPIRRWVFIQDVIKNAPTQYPELAGRLHAQVMMMRLEEV